MRTSDQINELAAALAKAQSAMEPAKFDCSNKHFGNKYASLSAIIEAIKKPLSANGIAFIQGVSFSERVIITTRLIHSSGQWIESELSLRPDKDNAQAVGSAVTYGKRYGLQAICGIVGDEDDDGEKTNARHFESAPAPKPAAPPLPPKAAASAPKNLPQEVKPTVEDFELGNFLMPEGVHKGRALKDIDPAALKSTLSWLDTQVSTNRTDKIMLEVRANLKRWFELNAANQGDGHPF